MNNKIYYMQKIDYENIDNVKFKDQLKMINYSFIIGDLKLSYKLLEKLCDQNTRNYKKNVIDYYYFIYYINKEEKYYILKYKDVLSKNNKNKSWLYYLMSEEDDIKKNNFYCATILSKAHFLYINKTFRKQIVYNYILNYSINEKHIENRLLNVEINRYLKKISVKSKLSIWEIDFIINICNILFSFKSMIKIQEKKHFVDIIVIKKILFKLIDELNYYVQFSDQRKKFICSVIITALKGLFNLDIFDKETKISILEMMKKFSNDNFEFLDKNSKIIYYINSGKNSFLEILLVIEKALEKNEEEVDLIQLIQISASFSKNKEELKEIYKALIKYEKKYQLNISDILYQSLVLGKEIIKLWIEGEFDKSVLTTNTYLSIFLSSTIDCFNNLLQVTNYLSIINKIEKIDCIEIYNWEMLDKKLNYDGSYKWLIYFLNKLDPNIDERTYNYLLELYKKIIDKEISVYIYDFIELNDIILKKIDKNSMFLANSITILSYVYQDYKSLESLINMFLEKSDIFIKESESYNNILYNIIVACSNYKYEKLNIKKLLSEIDCSNIENKELLKFYLRTNNDFNLNLDEYINLVLYLTNIYNNKIRIKKQYFDIIADITMKIEIDRKKEIFLDCDLIYYKNNNENKLFYNTRKKYNEEIKKCFGLIGIEASMNPDDYCEDHLLKYLLCRLLFDNIESYGLGKKIMIASNSTGEEILKELDKAIGYEDIRKQQEIIRAGGIIKDAFLLNIYDFHSLYKDIVSGNYKIFNNAFNNRFLSDTKIIHLSSLMLLSKIGALKVLKYNCFVSRNAYNQVVERFKNHYIELGDGILSDKVYYDDCLLNLNDSLEKLENDKKIISVTSANIFSNKKYSINEFDNDIIKIVIEKFRKNDNFCIITEDPFYYVNEIFSPISESTLSLLIDSYKNKYISAIELKSYIIKLESYNYNLDIGNFLFSYLISVSKKNEEIKEVIKIINKYKNRS